MKWKIGVLIVAVGLLVLGFKYFPGCAYCQPKVGPTLTLGTTSISILLADTPALREQGLSGRESLPPNTGMLFVFDTSGDYGFWMKEMKFDLDLVWIDENWRIVGLSEGLKPSTYPEIFYPPKPVKYVLEVPSGFYQGHSLKVGEILYQGQ